MTHIQAMEQACKELAPRRVVMTSNAYQIALKARRAELMAQET